MVIHKGFACKKTYYCRYVYNTLNLYRNQYHILKIISGITFIREVYRDKIKKKNTTLSKSFQILIK